MKLRCVWPDNYGFLKMGEIYTLHEKGYESYYVFRENSGVSGPWNSSRFEVVEESVLQPGWTHCNCGAITKNTLTSLCCDCAPKDAL